MREARTRERIEQMIALLGCRNQRVALWAEGRLIKIGRPAVDALMAATGSADARVRFRAVWALGKIGDRRALAAVVALTQDGDARVAYDAAAVLEDLKGDGFGTQECDSVL